MERVSKHYYYIIRGDKSYLGNKSERTHYNESTEAKIFIEFIALIVRNRIYTKLKEELERIDENLLLIV